MRAYTGGLRVMGPMGGWGSIRGDIEFGVWDLKMR